MRDPDMGLWSYAYDYAGNLTSQTDAQGQETVLHYDRLNRPTMREYLGASGATSVTYSYDSTAGGSRGKGRRTAMADGSGSTSWTYDSRGRTTSESKVITVTGSSTQNLLTQWSYTTRDVVASQTYPGGTGGEAGERVQTDYDVWGRPVVVSGTSLYVTSAAYDALGRPATMALGNGQQTQYVYYTATQQGGRLYQIKTGASGAPDGTQYLQYGYDRVGNVTVITDADNSGQLQLFGYDALNRLTSAAAIGGMDGYYTRTYQYDAIGNVTLGDGGYYYYESGRPHAVTTVGNPPWSMTAYYGYDGNGSATFITRTLLSTSYALTYDPENRVKQVVPSDGPTAIFRYDGDGTRVLGIVGGVTTTYAGTWYEYTTAGVSYYYFNGQRIATRTASGVTYIHRDHLGSAVTTTGVLTQGQRYDAWGETRSTSTVDTPYRYTGQREEDDLLLYFYNARWYDAALGRFIQADSIVPEAGNPQSLNRYSYVQNNPLRYSDPAGHALDDGFGVRWRYAPGGNLTAVDLFAPGTGQSDSDLTYFAVIEAQARAASGDVAELALANRTVSGRRSSYPEFSALVGDGKRWDVKDEMRKQFGDNYRLCSASECGWYEYSVLGNILYGFTGDQAGFVSIELWLGAGYAEATDPENTMPQNGSKAGPLLYLPMENLPYFGDNQQDFWAVSMGIALSRHYGADVNAQEFKALLVVFDDNLARGLPNEASYADWPYAPGSFDHP